MQKEPMIIQALTQKHDDAPSLQSRAGWKRPFGFYRDAVLKELARINVSAAPGRFCKS